MIYRRKRVAVVPAGLGKNIGRIRIDQAPHFALVPDIPAEQLAVVQVLDDDAAQRGSPRLQVPVRPEAEGRHRRGRKGRVRFAVHGAREDVDHPGCPLHVRKFPPRAGEPLALDLVISHAGWGEPLQFSREPLGVGLQDDKDTSYIGVEVVDDRVMGRRLSKSHAPAADHQIDEGFAGHRSENRGQRVRDGGLGSHVGER